MALRHGSSDSQRNPRSANRSRSFHPDFYASKNDAKALAVEIAPREAIPQRVVVTTLAPRALPLRAASDASAASAPALALELRDPILPGERRQAVRDAAPTLALGTVHPDESRQVLPAT